MTIRQFKTYESTRDLSRWQKFNMPLSLDMMHRVPLHKSSSSSQDAHESYRDRLKMPKINDKRPQIKYAVGISIDIKNKKIILARDSEDVRHYDLAEGVDEMLKLSTRVYRSDAIKGDDDAVSVAFFCANKDRFINNLIKVFEVSEKDKAKFKQEIICTLKDGSRRRITMTFRDSRAPMFNRRPYLTVGLPGECGYIDNCKAEIQCKLRMICKNKTMYVDGMTSKQKIVQATIYSVDLLLGFNSEVMAPAEEALSNLEEADKFISTFKECFGNYPYDASTMSSVAEDVMRRNYGISEKLNYNDFKYAEQLTAIPNLLKHVSTGGMIKVFSVGNQGKCYEYDQRSSYPTKMAELVSVNGVSPRLGIPEKDTVYAAMMVKLTIPEGFVQPVGVVSPYTIFREEIVFPDGEMTVPISLPAVSYTHLTLPTKRIV